MPTVLREGPYHFFFVSHDRGEPPHVHVRRESMVAKFWLDPVVLQEAGGYSRGELRNLIGLLNKHHKRLLEAWHDFFGD